MTTAERIEHLNSTALEIRTLAELGAASGVTAEQLAQGNVLVIGDYLRQISGHHRVTIERMQIQLPKKDGNGWYVNGSSPDLYKEQNGKLAPTKHLLERIAFKAGIRWDHAASGPVGAYHPERAIYKAVGAIRGLNGEWMQIARTKEWRLDVELEEILERAKVLKKWDNGRKRDATDAEKSTYIANETARAKKHSVSNIETKALNRVVKALVGLPSSGDEQYWGKPFYVPRIDLVLDPHDPDVRERLLNDAYGTAGFLGVQGPAQRLEAQEVAVEAEETADGERIVSELDREFPLPEPEDDGGTHAIGLPGAHQGHPIAEVWTTDDGPAYIVSLTQLPDGIDDELRGAAARWMEAQAQG